MPQVEIRQQHPIIPYRKLNAHTSFAARQIATRAQIGPFLAAFPLIPSPYRKRDSRWSWPYTAIHLRDQPLVSRSKIPIHIRRIRPQHTAGLGPLPRSSRLDRPQDHGRRCSPTNRPMLHPLQAGANLGSTPLPKPTWSEMPPKAGSVDTRLCRLLLNQDLWGTGSQPANAPAARHTTTRPKHPHE